MFCHSLSKPLRICHLSTAQYRDFTLHLWLCTQLAAPISTYRYLISSVMPTSATGFTSLTPGDPSNCPRGLVKSMKGKPVQWTIYRRRVCMRLLNKQCTDNHNEEGGDVSESQFHILHLLDSAGFPHAVWSINAKLLTIKLMFPKIINRKRLPTSRQRKFADPMMRRNFWSVRWNSFKWIRNKLDNLCKLDYGCWILINLDGSPLQEKIWTTRLCRGWP